MAGLSPFSEAHHPVRSISLPSRLDSTPREIEIKLKKLKSEGNGETIEGGFRKIAELYDCVEEMVKSPLTQQFLLHHQMGKQVEGALDMSIGLLDICGSARDLLLLMRENLLQLQSALRRKGSDLSIKSDIYTYFCFKKTAKKEISKSLGALKRIERSIVSHSGYVLVNTGHRLQMVLKLLRELNIVTIYTFESVLLFMSVPESRKRWSLISRLVSTKSGKGDQEMVSGVEAIDVALCSLNEKIGKGEAKADTQVVKRRLEALDGTIRGLESGLDSLFRCLIQHRVCLLNLLTP